MTKSTIHCLYLTKLCKWCFPSYPTGNFGRNQLLDCSSGLSPLYSTQTSDLHVSIVSRSSTRVSSGFNQFKYSSQSFGSQHNNLSPLLLEGFIRYLIMRGSFSLNNQLYKVSCLLLYQTPWFVFQDEWEMTPWNIKPVKTGNLPKQDIERVHISLFRQISRSISPSLVECFSPFLHSTYTLLVFYIIFSLRSFISPYAVSDFKDTYSFP